MRFVNVRTAIQIDHIFTATLQGIVFENCTVGINTAAPNLSSTVGSIILIDSTATNLETVIVSQHNKTADGSILIENLKMSHVGLTVSDRNGASVLAGTMHSKTIDSFIQGTVYTSATQGAYVERNLPLSRSPTLLDHYGAYRTKSRPQYEQYSSRCFSSVKDFGALGDGHTDTTNAINAALKANANRRITYFPAGNYRVTDTIHAPPGSRIVGEVWSTISGKCAAIYLSPAA
jgi:hypothetical protein